MGGLQQHMNETVLCHFLSWGLLFEKKNLPNYDSIASILKKEKGGASLVCSSAGEILDNLEGIKQKQ